MNTDFWGSAVPSWLGAIGGIASALVALFAFLGTIRNRRGLNTLKEGVSDIQPPAPSVDPRLGVVLPPPPRWHVTERGRGRYLLTNAAGISYTLTGFRDVTPDGDDAAALLQDLPVLMDPGVSIPFRIDKTLVSPGVTAIQLQWTDSDGQQHSTTLYV